MWSATQSFAGYVLINPLHAAEPTTPMEPSPYLPATRRYVNPLYLRPESINEFATLGRSDRRAIRDLRRRLVRGLIGVDSVRRDEAWDAKIAALRIVYDAGLKPARALAFADYCRREGRSLRDYATWCALTLWFEGLPWTDWPVDYQRPTSPEVASFVREHADDVRFFQWLQWQAELQLAQTQATAKGVGMPLGIIVDLAVGVSERGAETWIFADVFAPGGHRGCTPGRLQPDGRKLGAAAVASRSSGRPGVRAVPRHGTRGAAQLRRGTHRPHHRPVPPCGGCPRA